MIHGVNFGRPAVPPDCKPDTTLWSGERYRLVGAFDTDEEKERMIMQASNGRRQIHIAKLTNGRQGFYVR